MKPYLFTALILLQFLDVGTTLYGIKKGARETNYVLTKLYDFFGDQQSALVVSKALFVIFLAVFYSQIHEAVFFCLTLLYVWVGYNNIKVIKRLR